LNDNCHIHGGLRILVQGRFVPRLGFWGPDDVCFSTWFEEFENIVQTFDESEAATYIFDEGEQSQPAYVFQKKGGHVFLSVADAAFSGGRADPEWQNVPFLYQDFKAQYQRMKADFLQELSRAAPHAKDEWLGIYLKGVFR